MTVTVNAPADTVLAFLRDVDNQHKWFPGNLESEVTETGPDGFVSKARLVNDVGVAKDEFVLNYTHAANSMSWKLAGSTKVQKSQEGSWTVVAKGDKSEVTMALSLDTSLPLPGFVKKKTMKDTIKGATGALVKQF